MQRDQYYNAQVNLTKGPHMTNTNLISIEKIEKAIYLIRGEKMMQCFGERKTGVAGR